MWFWFFVSTSEAENGNLRGRTVGDRLKCVLTEALVRSPDDRSWCAKILISRERTVTDYGQQDQVKDELRVIV